jgi:choline transport protein
MPVTPQKMSYVSVVSVGLVTFVTILWFSTKKGKFRGPKIDMDLLNARRHAAIEGVEEIVTVDVQADSAKDGKSATV